MILFKPCPPCCQGTTGTTQAWTDIRVSDNFWGKPIHEKKKELKSINTPALAVYLDPQIARLESGTDLERGE